MTDYDSIWRTQAVKGQIPDISTKRSDIPETEMN